MAVQPPEIEAFPPPPQRKNKDTFANLFDDVITWFSRSVSKVAQACLSAYQNAVDADASAVAAAASADAAVTAAGAVQWVSGTSYVKGRVVWSPINARTYRRLVAGAGTTDPSLDKANWTTLSFEPSFLASAVVTSAVANIDFLSIFSADFDKYTIEVQGIACSGASSTTSASIFFSPAVAGAIPASMLNAAMNTGESNLANTTSPLFVGTAGSLTAGANAAASFTIEVRNVNSNLPKSVSSRGLGVSGGTAFQAFNRDGASLAQTPLSGFRLTPSSGNFTAGTIRIYGHRNS